MQSICGTANIIGQKTKKQTPTNSFAEPFINVWEKCDHSLGAAGAAGRCHTAFNKLEENMTLVEQAPELGSVVQSCRSRSPKIKWKEMPSHQELKANPSVQCWRTEPPCFNQFSELNRSRTENLWDYPTVQDFGLLVDKNWFEHVFFFKMIQLPCLFTARWYQIGQCR